MPLWKFKKKKKSDTYQGETKETAQYKMTAPQAQSKHILFVY